MDDIDYILSCLQKTPLILKNLLKNIPIEVLKTRRIPKKWSIHEHVCHLAQAEAMIIERFEQFKTIDYPTFNPYLPGKTVSADGLIDRDMQIEMEEFNKLRGTLLDLVSSFDNTVWSKPAKHPQYTEYDAYILLRHTLMHDHFHMYRIEELWLTKQEFL